MITNEDGCSISSDDVFVNCESLGIDDIVSADIRVYPNPGNGEFNLDIEGYAGELSLQIFDIMGREVKNKIYLFPLKIILFPYNYLSHQACIFTGKE